MHIKIFAHPAFLRHQSMPRFTQMLKEGMETRGHKVDIWTPKAVFSKFNLVSSLQKWLGYIDQYIIFPILVKRNLKKCHPKTLFVFSDHALGPWVPLVSDRFHVIHCHDFLAQFSALGGIKENPTSWTGKRYQSFIRWGYSKGKNFISVSKKTREDLHQFVKKDEIRSEVVYNGFSRPFLHWHPQEARKLLEERISLKLPEGYILHVGGNQWYKNRIGVIEIYNAWRSSCNLEIPLLMIGERPTKDLLVAKSFSSYNTSIFFLSGLEDKYVHLAYAGAAVFLFPSLAEGFGWPIAEAMASGCPVITTNELPMTEVTGQAGFLIGKRPIDNTKHIAWANEGACMVNRVFGLTKEQRNEVVEAGLRNAERFDSKIALDKIEAIYLDVIARNN